ncbi:MAG: hypothetical protein ACOY3E_00015 [Pseudomonadota bacterium]
MEIGRYGAASTVTGSRYRVSSEKFCALIDCGLFQGYKQLRECNWTELPFEGDTLDAVLFTHAYRDHNRHKSSKHMPALLLYPEKNSAGR